VNDPEVPEAGGLEKVNVQFAVSVTLWTLPSSKSIVSVAPDVAFATTVSPISLRTGL
jgi:hypothetical protein